MSDPEAETGTTHWALLVGINFYKKNPLFGCVRDVNLLKDHFTAASLVSPVTTVFTLTATAPGDERSTTPIEEEELWPTYHNLIARLEIIERNAKPGHSVYMHYSGHGTNFHNPSKYGNKNTGNLALVLFDAVKGVRYLTTQELAMRLNLMVQRGIFVTLVLDCCFSGSVVRANRIPDTTIRTVSFDPTVDSIYLQESNDMDLKSLTSIPFRTADLIADLVIDDTTGYAAFAACGPHELAKELNLSTGEKHGALSFFLLSALKTTWRASGGRDVTNRALYGNLLTQFHANWPAQTPMMYGNRDAPFFGSSGSEYDVSLIPVFRFPERDLICLKAGQAHGISVGDELVVYPFDSPKHGGALCGIQSDLVVKVKVDNVMPLTSTVTASEPGSSLGLIRERQVWKAKLFRSAHSRRIPVRLMVGVENRKVWTVAADKKRYLKFCSGEEEAQSCLFNVTLTQRGEFEVLNESFQKLGDIPSVPSGPGAESVVVDLLNHLAAFKFFEGILNQKVNTVFDKSFRLRLSSIRRPGQDLGRDGGIITIEEGDTLCLDIENWNKNHNSQRKDGTLFITIFDLTPEWEIASLLTQLGGPGFLPVPAMENLGGGQYSGKDQIKWLMTFPDALKRRGVSHCDDVLKVFVTSKPGWFGSVLLPKITSSSLGVCSEATRGGGVDRVAAFIEELLLPSTRGVEGEGEDWVVVNYIIRTTAKP